MSNNSPSTPTKRTTRSSTLDLLSGVRREASSTSSPIEVVALPASASKRKHPSSAVKAKEGAKKAKDKQAGESMEYKINARHFNYAFMKAHPLPHKPSVAQLVTTQTFRMKDIDGNSLFARLWKQFQFKRTFGEVLKEDTPWLITYSTGPTAAKTLFDLDLNDVESIDNLVQALVEKKAKGSLWLNLYEQKGPDASDSEDEEKEQNSGVRKATRRSEVNAAAFTSEVNIWVQKLQARYGCNIHNHAWCYQQQDGEHRRLNYAQLRSWANMLADPENPVVDVETLPNTREFDILRTRRAGSSTSAASQTPTMERQLSSNTLSGQSAQSSSSPYAQTAAHSAVPYPPYWPPVPPFYHSGIPQVQPGPVCPVSAASVGLFTPEDMRVLQQDPKGVNMGLEEFCTALSLPTSVRSVLDEQEIDGPKTLLSIPGELYTKAKDDNGLGLKLGAAIRLKNAMLAWARGEEMI